MEYGLVREVDCTTGVTTDREMTDAEKASVDAMQAEFEATEAARVAAEEARAIAKASAEAKLAALGLTPEEIAAL